jgi:prepilin-type N-terminal cleavage/methylation domain-containing protein
MKKLMNKKRAQSGLTLTEMVVVVSIIAVFAVLGLPAFRAFISSIESEGCTRAVISSTLSSARALAAVQHRCAGIRFQNKYQPDGKGCQYMVFIVHDSDETGLNDGFRAVDGYHPIKLPDSVGVMDLRVRTNNAATQNGAEDTGDRDIVEDDLDDTNPANLDTDGRNIYVTDTTSFSVLFSPSGRLVIHDVRVRNRDGDYQPLNLNDSADDIFNSPVNITDNKTGMFVQDDYADRGLGAEPSRNCFVIYDKTEFGPMNETTRFNYLQGLDKVYINPYTGTMIEK